MENTNQNPEEIKQKVENYFNKIGKKESSNIGASDMPTPKQTATSTEIPDSIKMPEMGDHTSDYVKKSMIENDPDLVMTYETIGLPSEGKYHKGYNGLKQLDVEYLTSRDEDLLTTPSFIDDNSVIDRLLERKIVTKGVNPATLLSGDRSAIILYLRTSSYGNFYKVSVPDPRNGKSFEAEVDLTKLKYKENKIFPDENFEFTVELPMRKKMAKFKLLTSGEENHILRTAEAVKKEYNREVSEYNTMRIKASITEIDGKRDRSYIDQFVNVMPAADAYAVRKKIIEVSPEVEMRYEFTAPDGYKFNAPLSMGVDFFFPSF